MTTRRAGVPPAALAVDAVLGANQAFYEAFNARDAAAMQRLWSAEAPVVCVHPGWNPLTTREEILASFAAILANPEAPQLDCEDPEPLLHGDVAFVVCHERVEGALLACVNGFRLEDGVWRMILHQAGPVGEEPSRRPAFSFRSRRIH